MKTLRSIPDFVSLRRSLAIYEQTARRIDTRIRKAGQSKRIRRESDSQLAIQWTAPPFAGHRRALSLDWYVEGLSGDQQPYVEASVWVSVGLKGDLVRKTRCRVGNVDGIDSLWGQFLQNHVALSETARAKGRLTERGDQRAAKK